MWCRSAPVLREKLVEALDALWWDTLVLSLVLLRERTRLILRVMLTMAIHVIRVLVLLVLLVLLLASCCVLLSVLMGLVVRSIRNTHIAENHVA